MIFIIPVIIQTNLFYIIVFNLFALFLIFSFLLRFITTLSSFYFFVIVEIREIIFIFSWFSRFLGAILLGFLCKFGFILLILQKTIFVEGSVLIEWILWSILVNLNFLVLINMVLIWTLVPSIFVLRLILGAIIFGLSWGNLSLTLFSCLSSLTHWRVSLEISVWRLLIVILIYTYLIFMVLGKLSNLSLLGFIIFSSFPLTPLFLLKISLLSLTSYISLIFWVILMMFASLSIFLFERILFVLEKFSIRIKTSLIFLLLREVILCLFSF